VIFVEFVLERKAVIKKKSYIFKKGEINCVAGSELCYNFWEQLQQISHLDSSQEIDAHNCRLFHMCQ